MIKEKLLLLGIILLFLLTRFYRISDLPPSLYWDEASIGYNAYALAQSGRDEWGEFLPLHFRAFGEFKLPVYVYSVAFLTKLFGLSEMAVRTPAIFFSAGVAVLTYLLTFKIFQKRQTALLSAFFLIISPWFFILSRTGYEATAGLMFYLLGVYLFLFFGRNRLFVILSLFSFILSIYSYNSFRIIVPLTLLIFYIYLAKQTYMKIKEYLPILVISFLLFVISIVPIWRLVYLDNGVVRMQTVGILNNSVSTDSFLLTLLRNYIVHFSPDFLFLNGDSNLRSHQGGWGQLYWLDLIFILAGFIYILRLKKFLNCLPLILIILATIPAAITKESPHALRSILMAPSLAILVALGVWYINEKMRRKGPLLWTIISIYSLLFGLYFYQFLSFYPQKSSGEWQYGYRKLFSEYKLQFWQYDKVLISDAYAQPYIFALYYLKYDPQKFRTEVEYNSVDKWGFSTVTSFNNFVFSPINKDHLPKGKVLVFASPKEKLEDIEERDVIRNLDNSVAFFVYDYEK